MKPMKEGKVREIYDNKDSLIIVATDRISCFDVILHNTIENKGKILTLMSKFWFEYTKDICSNHVISFDVDDMPDDFHTPYYEGRSLLCKKLTMIPIECIVRGYLTGSGFASYQKTKEVCGISLPDGLVDSSKLPHPIYTPSTKAELGQHDKNISFEESIDFIESSFPGKGKEYATKIRDYSLALYTKCAQYALTHGIIIADTKFEFGIDEHGDVVVGDEMLTPDSSRFWSLENYEPGKEQLSFDKQFARDWLKSHNHDWTLPEDIVLKTIEKYKNALQLLTGQTL